MQKVRPCLWFDGQTMGKFNIAELERALDGR